MTIQLKKFIKKYEKSNYFSQETKKESVKNDEANSSPLGLSILNYPLLEEKRLINSPRSLEACRLEGILPENLLYRYYIKQMHSIDQKISLITQKTLCH